MFTCEIRNNFICMLQRFIIKCGFHQCQISFLRKWVRKNMHHFTKRHELKTRMIFSWHRTKKNFWFNNMSIRLCIAHNPSAILHYFWKNVPKWIYQSDPYVVGSIAWSVTFSLWALVTRHMLLLSIMYQGPVLCPGMTTRMMTLGHSQGLHGQWPVQTKRLASCDHHC